MSTSTTSPTSIGTFVRRRFPCGHRTGQRAQILTTTTTPARDHFLVIYHDGDTELLPIETPDHHYEFGPAPTYWSS
ncbi:hypothetical protein [Rhodococcus koreensis]|uniref:hypothetical protein n=1 Tax=Rhodococcus koreensis TaxID=99653 RepID=UPI00366E1BDC